MAIVTLTDGSVVKGVTSIRPEGTPKPDRERRAADPNRMRMDSDKRLHLRLDNGRYKVVHPDKIQAVTGRVLY